MTVITTRIVNAPDGSVSLADPVPAGEYMATIAVSDGEQRAAKPFDIDSIGTLDLGPWPEGISLRREDLYGDDGR